MSVRQLEQQNPRVESGVVRFGNDWCGIFLRGDDAFAFAMALESFMADPSDEFSKCPVQALISTLKSCDERLVSQDVPKESDDE